MTQMTPGSPAAEVGIKAVQLRENTEVKGVRKSALWLAFSPVLDKLGFSHIKSLSAMHI